MREMTPEEQMKLAKVVSEKVLTRKHVGIALVMAMAERLGDEGWQLMLHGPNYDQGTWYAKFERQKRYEAGEGICQAAETAAMAIFEALKDIPDGLIDRYRLQKDKADVGRRKRIG